MPDAKEVLEHLEKKPKFKVGDRVVSEHFGKGTVTAIEKNTSLPIKVHFDHTSAPPADTRTQFFTSEGEYFVTPMDYHIWNVKPEEVNIKLLTAEEVTKSQPAPSSPINPDHYRAKGIPEAIDIMRGLMTDEQLEGFLWGNIIKYAYRYGRKGDTQGAKTETAAKIKWYADAMIGYLSGH